MRHSAFVNSSNESNYVFLVSDYIGPFQKLNWSTHLFSGDNTQLHVYRSKQKLFQQLTQSPLLLTGLPQGTPKFIKWVAFSVKNEHYQSLTQ